MSPKPPNRILFLRPDTYGDLFLFEPVPRMVRHAWPETEVAVLIRQPYADAVPLFPTADVRWLTTACNPYRESPGANPAALEDLREVVRAFAPDCVVAACVEQTWLEAAVAAFLPEARQVSLGDGLTDPVLRAALDAVVPVDWPMIYREKVSVAPEWPEWEKHLCLTSALLGREAPRWWPVAQVPEVFRADAARILAGAGLSAGTFVVCAAAGTANVQIKCWPAEHYGGLLAWLERERGVRALLIGHVSEREHLEGVRQAARRGGADPALWVGQDGEMPVAAGLLEAARFYFGNDTGALHLAAALGRPVVSIFGGGHWPRFQPVARRTLTLVQPLPCFGCAWDCYYGDAPCVRTISPASVQRALEEFLRDDREGQRVYEAEGLDSGARALIHTATPLLRSQREDRTACGKQIMQLGAWLSESEADRTARGQQVTELTAWLLESEMDRAARGKLLEAMGVMDAGAVIGPARKDKDGLSTAAEPVALPEKQEADGDGDLAIMADLRLRLQGSQTQELAARTQARRFARELAIARRLLKFSFGRTMAEGFRPRPALITGMIARAGRLRAALGTEKIIFQFDSCQLQGTTLSVSGWAFRRAPEWDAAATMVTLLFRHGTTVQSFATSRVQRLDVASHFAAQRKRFAGAARGLEGAGFACEIPRASLAANVALEIMLHLECAGMTCEQSTGKQLWL